MLVGRKPIGIGKLIKLYRHYDKNGDLLYVGISLSAVYRLSQHRNSSHWYNDIAKVTIENCDNKVDALKAELMAIKNEKPRWNIKGDTMLMDLLVTKKEYDQILDKKSKSIEDVIAMIVYRCFHGGGVVKWSEAVGEGCSMVYAVIRKDKKPTKRLLKKLGLRVGYKIKEAVINPMQNVSYN